MYQEAECVLSDGICKLKKDCPADVVDTYAALCPKQKDSSVICCPKLARPKCQSGNGECTRNCPPKIRQENYNHECPAGDYCCVWL